jgi:hypothetical protein
MHDIAETLATEFRDAVAAAEKTDMDTIDKILDDLNRAHHDFMSREEVLSKQEEQATKTLLEIATIRGHNVEAFKVRVDALRDLLSTFKETKGTVAKAKPLKLVGTGNG